MNDSSALECRKPNRLPSGFLKSILKDIFASALNKKSKVHFMVLFKCVSALYISNIVMIKIYDQLYNNNPSDDIDDNDNVTSILNYTDSQYVSIDTFFSAFSGNQGKVLLVL